MKNVNENQNVDKVEFKLNKNTKQNDNRIGELRQLRKEDRKVFNLNNGVKQAEFYPGNILVFDDGTESFIEPDNTFVKSENGKCHKNRKGNFLTKFSCEEDNDELFSIKKGIYEICIYSEMNSKANHKGVASKICKRKGDGIDNSTMAVFENVYNGTDLEYSLIAKGVKENIVVNERNEVYRYSFGIKCKNLSVKLEDKSKRIAFIAKDTNKEVFYIPAPFMIDAAGNKSSDVFYEVSEIFDSQVNFAIIADSKWINVPERVFPVVIDPQILISGGTLNTYSWNNGYMSESGNHYVGYYSDGCGGYLEERMYLKLTEPTLPNNSHIRKAELEFTVDSIFNIGENACRLGLYNVTENITTGYCTPSYDGTIIDYAAFKADKTNGSVITFDITDAIQKCFNNGGNQVNFMVKLMQNTTDAGISFYGDSDSNYCPKLKITYTSGYSSTSIGHSHSHSLGRFGSGTVDLTNGNLIFETSDFAWGGNRMPVTIKHLYTSALCDYQYTANNNIMLNVADFSAMKLGLGFRLNLMQSMIYDATKDKYTYTDENGNETYFVLSEKTTECDVTSQCYQLYEDTDGNGIYYDDRNHTITMGDTKYLFDEAGRLIRITDKYNNQMSINYTSGQITSVTDGVGREFVFNYTDGYLFSITAPDHETGSSVMMNFIYDENKLKAIRFPDGRVANIEYIANKPSAVVLYNTELNPVYKVEYELTDRRVTNVAEYGVENGQFVAGPCSNYEYSAASNRTTVTTVEPRDIELGETADKRVTTVYTFDDEGNRLGEYAYSTGSEKTEVTSGEGINPYTSGMSSISNVDNLLLNHNIADLSNWAPRDNNDTSTHVSAYSREAFAKFGKKVLRLQTSNIEATSNGVFQQTVSLPAGEYTLSAYTRVGETYHGYYSFGGYIQVTDAAGNVLAESEHLYNYNSEFIRLTAPFKLDTAQSVRVNLLADGSGVTYFDGIQLEKNAFANKYNLLTNSNFQHGPVGWEQSGSVDTSTDEYFNMSRSVRMSGGLDVQNSIKQPVLVKGAKGTRETFTLSAWAKAFALKDTERENCPAPEFNVSAVIKYTDGTEETHTADFAPAVSEWQPATVQFAKSEFKEVESLTVCCNYSNNIGTAYFDDIRLFRDNIETELAESDFASGEADTIEQIYIEDEIPYFEEIVDEFGNTVTSTTYTDGEFGTIYCSSQFDETGNNLIAETDTRGNTTHYTVDPDTSRNKTVVHRDGNKTEYEYDAAGRTTKITNKSADDTVKSTLSYGYDDFNNLKEITRGDTMQYSLIYNAFHNLESIKAGNANLITYDYKNGNGRMKSVTYSNGNIMKATYNGKGQIIAEKWYNTATDTEPMAYYKYVYDNAGNIVRSIDIKAGKEYNYTYEGGRLVRSAEHNVTFNAQYNVILRDYVGTIDYTYGKDGRLVKKNVYVYGASVQYFTEYPENANPVVKVKYNNQSIESHSKTDSFGRKEFEELQAGTGFISRQFMYERGKATEEHKQNGKLKSSPTTSLVKQIIFHNDRTLSYEYDKEERITKVTDSLEGVTEYTYDAQGQLLTEVRNGVTANTMTYDNYGNILSKNGVIYEYDSVWKDKLIKVGTGENSTITYDAQGNPTNYLGHTLTWEKGRQLKSFGNNTYTYNANGIRTSKTVNGVKHTFMLEGSKITKEAWGENTLLPLYNNENSICGIIYNRVMYLFLKNLQGDIIAITNQNGETIARYAYDAWGKCTVIQDSSDCLIATINPFRYRGYYYDQEIGMYYLQSRYYDPNVGRFINADAPDFVAVSGENLFSYCGNCPTKNADYAGYCFTPTYWEGVNLKTIDDSPLVKEAKKYGWSINAPIGKPFDIFDSIETGGYSLKMFYSTSYVKNYSGKKGLAFSFSSETFLDATMYACYDLGNGFSLSLAPGQTWHSYSVTASISHCFTNDGLAVSLNLEFTLEKWVILAVAAVVVGIVLLCIYAPVAIPFVANALSGYGVYVVGIISTIIPQVSQAANTALAAVGV